MSKSKFLHYLAVLVVALALILGAIGGVHSIQERHAADLCLKYHRPHSWIADGVTYCSFIKEGTEYIDTLEIIISYYDAADP